MEETPLDEDDPQTPATVAHGPDGGGPVHAAGHARQDRGRTIGLVSKQVRDAVEALQRTGRVNPDRDGTRWDVARRLGLDHVDALERQEAVMERPSASHRATPPTSSVAVLRQERQAPSGLKAVGWMGHEDRITSARLEPYGQQWMMGPFISIIASPRSPREAVFSPLDVQICPEIL